MFLPVEVNVHKHDNLMFLEGLIYAVDRVFRLDFLRVTRKGQ